MTISIRDANLARGDRDWIATAYGDYLQDLSAGGTGVFPALTVTGQSEAEILQTWFRDPRATPLLILREGQPVGFALIERQAPSGVTPSQYRMTEFFIRRPDRGQGLGREAASLIFSRFPGEWQVSESTRHRSAIAFWRRVIGAYTAGHFNERQADGEVRHDFTSPAPVRTSR